MIRAARKSRGLTQQQLADRLGEYTGKREWLAKIERGNIQPKAPTIELIFEALDYELKAVKK